MSKYKKHYITVDREPNLLLNKKEESKDIWTKRIPLVNDDKIRKGSHYIYVKPSQNHYDIYNGKQETRKKDRTIANKGPTVVILSGKNKEIFSTDRCDEAEEVFFRFLVENPRAAEGILKRRNNID